MRLFNLSPFVSQAAAVAEGVDLRLVDAKSRYAAAVIARGYNSSVR
jgi:hypothetical protein